VARGPLPCLTLALYRSPPGRPAWREWLRPLPTWRSPPFRPIQVADVRGHCLPSGRLSGKRTGDGRLLAVISCVSRLRLARPAAKTEASFPRASGPGEPAIPLRSKSTSPPPDEQDGSHHAWSRLRAVKISHSKAVARASTALGRSLNGVRSQSSRLGRGKC
jgi:hypothetical protein